MCACSGNCNCDNSTVLPIGPQGDPGTDGADGADGTNGTNGVDGVYGGFSGEFQYSTDVTNAAIIAPQLRFNNTASTLVTEIYVFDTGVGSIDYDLFLDSFSNGSNYGLIRVFKEFDSTKFWMGQVTGVTDNGTFHTLTVTYIASSNNTIPTNIFTGAENVVLTFSPRGDTGATGAAASITADGESSALDSAMVITTYTLVPNATFLTLAAGTYLFWFEATAAVNATSDIYFRYYVAGAAVDIEHRYRNFVASGITGVAVNAKLTLASPATVEVRGKYLTAGATLLSQSLQYLKIA